MSQTLYVGNLAPETSEAHLRGLFASHGHEVQAIKLATSGKNSKPRGFAFVELASEEDAAAALKALAGADLDGRELKIGEAARDRPKMGPAHDEDSSDRFSPRGGTKGKRRRR